MRVVLVNHSDSKGGASVATYRLCCALREQGVDARMLVMHKTLPDDGIEVLEPALRRKAAFLGEHLDIFLRNGLSRRDLFKASVAVCGMDVHSHPWVREADVVVLGWINQGMLSLRGIGRIDKPIVWIMHDMWCCTGVCHHSHSCERYMQQCGHCPLALGGRVDHDMSWSTHRRKAELYTRRPITFVAVSRWLQERCLQSSLLRDMDVRMITNPMDIAGFGTEPSRGRAACGLPEGKRLVAMGAARLDDPIKGLDIAIDALNHLEGEDVAAVLFGGIREPRRLEALRIPYVHTGPVSDPSALRDIYAHSQVVLSTSHYESLGLTLIEGMAAGCVPVTFGTGGQTDIVDHLSTGYVARYPDAADVAEGIRFALSGAVDTAAVRRAVLERFDAAAVARRYIELFEQVAACGHKDKGKI